VDVHRNAVDPGPRDARTHQHEAGSGWQDDTAALVRKPSGDIVKLRTELVIAKKPLNIDETYPFDSATARWTTLTQGNAYRGVATPWLANTWIFDGTLPSGDRRAPVRMADATLGANAFRREYQRPDGDVWKTFQSETCRRT